jgi:hypothetical protein
MTINARLTYSHGSGWFIETQADDTSPWVACAKPVPTIEEAVAISAGLVGLTLSFPIATDSGAV